MGRSLASALFAALLLAGCPGTPPPPSYVDPPQIVDMQASTPVLEGSLLRVTGLHFDGLGPEPTLAVDGDAGGDDLPLEETGEVGELFFRVTPNLVNALGPGPADVTVVLRGDNGSSDPFPFFLEVAFDLPVRLDGLTDGFVNYNDEALVSGDGFISATEGTITARFEGTFVEDGGGPTRSVSVGLPVLPAERFARDRGLVRLTTALGSVHPGTFDGTITLESELTSGGRTSSSGQTIQLVFGPPDLFAIDPAVASIEQIVAVRGAGFLGGPDEPDEQTLIRLSGEFDPDDGAPAPFDDELVLTWRSGTEMQAVIEYDIRSNNLISKLFRARRGVFTGMATPVVIKGAEEQQGSPVPFTFTLAQVTQVVFVRFLPGFYASLPYFGLEASAGQIESLVEARMESIYDGWNVDVRLEEPTDFSQNGYATVEVGGPDPNGTGLFGFDNTPGKDVGNVRLYDKIGGDNWETQDMGYRGFGGVFIESMLYFSSHPDLPGDAPPSRPDPDPLFDEIFDPVRTGNPATLAEIAGDGPGDRVNEVHRALEALASMVGETTAHELGHSLGLAEPFGPPTVFHNAFDEEGCLMDSGGNRPIGERTAQPGFAETHLCHTAPDYLDDILKD